MREIDEKDRRDALARHLGCEAGDLSTRDRAPRAFFRGDEEYLVLTDEEAGELVRECIDDDLWAFKPSFIISHSNLPLDAEEMVRFFCEKKCGGANDTVRALIVDMERFAVDAIALDGRGWFISPYDGKEREVRVGDVTLFVYRMN